MRTFKVRCDESVAQQFEAVAASAAQAVNLWVVEQRQRIEADAAAAGWATAQRAQARRELRVQRAELRRAGELRGTHGPPERLVVIRWWRGATP